MKISPQTIQSLAISISGSKFQKMFTVTIAVKKNPSKINFRTNLKISRLDFSPRNCIPRVKIYAAISVNF